MANARLAGADRAAAPAFDVRPEQEVARRLEAGVDPVRAVREWIEQVSPVLAAYRSSEGRDLPTPAADAVPPAADPLLILVARQLIADTPDAAALAGELDRCARWSDASDRREDAAAALQAVRAWREDSERLREERDVLRLQLRRVQAELEARYRKSRDHLVRTERAAIAAERRRIAGAVAGPGAAPASAAAPTPRPTEPDTATHATARPEEPLGHLRAVARTWRHHFRRARLERHAALVRASPLFDAEWYRKRYKDAAKANIDPARYYVQFGAAKKQSPGPRFDSAAYLEAHPEAVAAGANPLVHHLIATRRGRWRVLSRRDEPAAGS